MNLKTFISQQKPLLSHFMNTYIQNRIQEHASVPFYADTLNRLYTFSTSGKMLRGVFILLIYSFIKDLTKENKSYHAAAAIELIQSALLIHDDIIDNDEVRRGNKTIFAQYNDYAKEQQYSESSIYGRNLGICVGDIALFTAFDLLANCSNDTLIVKKLSQLFARETHLVAIGEMIDVDMAANSKEPTVEQIQEMYKLKTARYSFSLPFEAGAILAEVPEDVTKKLARLGENTGILFQIHDDWLGLYGTEEQIGKPIGSDIREKKKTIYRSLLYKSLPKEDKSKLDTFSIDQVHSLLTQYNIVEQADTYKQCYEKESQDIIETLPFNKEQKELLLELVDLVTSRTK